MKTKFKRIGKQSLSIVLAVMMMVSTMLVGMVTSNAAEFTGDSLYIDLSQCESSITLKGINLYTSTNDTDPGWIDNFDALEGKIYKFSVKDYVTKYSKILKVQISLESKNGIPKEVVDANKNCLQVNYEGTDAEWITYGGSTPTKRTVTVHYTPAHVSSIKLDTTLVTSDNPNVTVDDGATPILTVALNPGYSITSVTQDGDPLTAESNGTYKLKAVTAATDIQVNTTSSSSGGEGTGDPTYKLMLSKDSNVVGNDNEGTSVVDNLEFYKLSDGVTYTVIVPTSKFVKDNNYFAFTKDGTKNGIAEASKVTFEDGIKSLIQQVGTQPFNGCNTFGYVSINKNSKIENVKISYNTTTRVYHFSAVSATATEPVPVTLNAVTVEGGNAYISSYTDNDTGTVVTNPPETTVTTVNAKAGTDVVFKAVAVANYYVKWQTSLDTTVATGNTFTLSNVSGTKPISVTATYVKIETYNVTVQAQVGGSVSATLGDDSLDVSNPISVASNQVITLKAIPDSERNYVFKGWDVNSTNYTLSSGTLTSKEIHVTPLGNVTFTAKFEVMQGLVDETYKLMYSSSDSTLTGDTKGDTVQTGLTFYKEDTKYKVKVPASILNKNGNNYLAFTTGTGATALEGMVARNGKKPGFAVEKSSDAYFSEPKINDRNEGNNKYYFIYFGIKSELESIIVEYDTNTNSYTLSAVPETPLENAVDVYVTNGNLVGIQYGSTKITSGITEKYFREDTTSSYIKYRAKKDDKVTVECTMDDAKAKLGYYVYAFVVNGNKVDAVQSGNGVYQTAIPVTITENTEITPVYYNTNIEKNGDYVTLYVNAPDELATEWGRSISIYSWYNVDGAEMDGAYPGQLMMRDTQGKYVAKISKYAYAVENGKFVRQNTQKIAGITINNYYENQGSVHQQFLSGVQKHNGQSYDYNDFVKIAEMGYDTVEFDVKYFKNEGTSADPKSNQSALIGNKTTLGSAPISTKLSDSLHVTPYKELTNIDGKPVSILGYDDATIRTLQGNAGETITGLDKGNKLHIISVGNQDNTKNGGTAKWATCWYVYDPTGKYVTCGLPSDFIPSGSINPDGKFVPDKSQSKAYQAIVEKGLQYTSAEISYEVELDDTKSVEKNTGVRVDGRWYYARSADTVAVDLGIIYKADENDTVWTVDNATDESAITGKVTGATASFSYTDTIGNTHTNLASGTVERNTVLSINATNGTNYKFAGWAVPAYDAEGKLTGYTQLGLTDFNATYTVGTATKLYAMYEPYTRGELTLTHSKYVGDGAHNGLGLFTIKAYVGDESGNPDPSAVSPASVSDSVTLPIENNPDAYVWVTLKTESYANSRFLNFYHPEVRNFTTTLIKDDNINDYYDKVCTATKSFKVKVSDLFDGDKQAIMALDYYSDLKLPEVASNITFNYNPYKEAPSPNPQPDMNGSGTTKFALTITKNSDNSVAYTTDSDVASLTLKGNTDLKAILEDYTTKSEDYTVTISLKAEAGSHCKPGETYRQTVNADGTYTYKNATSDTGGIWTYAEGKYTAKLSDLFDKEKQEFKSNTINFYTNFTAQSFSYDVTFNYIGYESRAYYDKYGYTQSPIISPESSWLKTYKATGTFYGAEIDTYVNTETNKFKEAFLLKVAPYEDNFVQTILWKLDKVNYTSQGSNSIVATVDAEYDNGKVTVQAVFPNAPLESYTVNYGSLVKEKNYIGTTPLPEGKEGYLIVAPDTYGDKTFSYWTIEKELANGDKIEVAKCYNREFNYIAYDNYIVTAHYGENVTVAKNEISATMTFLEYSRNQTASSDGNTDKVYADFAVSFDYYGKMLNPQKDAQNPNVICGVAFVVNKNVSSPSDATQPLVVSKDELLETIKGLNNSSSTNALSDGSKVYNYKINNKDLDNKNRIEYSWKVSNNENNNNLTILAYSYIYNTADETIKCISEPQSFKFYNVGHKTYENKQ